MDEEKYNDTIHDTGFYGDDDYDDYDAADDGGFEHERDPVEDSYLDTYWESINE